MTNHNDVVNNIKVMLDGAEPPLTQQCCIYRVPFRLRKLNEDAYTPTVVSIGPFHHNSHPRLHNMEKHKLMLCKAFLERTETSLDSWIRYIEGVEPDFRRCYSDTLEFNKEQLVNIIFVDSGFIFELFWRNYYGWSREDDMFLKTPWLSSNIREDMLLLENQLPFFVLDGLFNLCFTSRSRSGNNRIPSFLEITIHYFDEYNRSKLNFNNTNIKHFTDLIRTFHLQHPPEIRPSRTDIGDIVTHLPSATELSEAGVRFKVIESEYCLLKLDFSGRVLEIPQLVVDDVTELLFRNMVALEQCHYPYHPYITDYVDFLDYLVNTSRDVDELVRKTVLVNWLGDTDSVANLFNGLMKNITVSNSSSHYLRISEDLNVFHRNPCRKLMSTLRRDYCKSAWQTAASIAGIVLLFLSLVQAVCSVWQVIQH